MSVAYWAAGVAQIWHKKKFRPLLEDVSHSGLQPNVARKWCPSLVIRGTYHAADIGQMWKKMMHLVGGLCLMVDFDQMWSKMMHLVRGLCLTAVFNQMWSKMCSSLEDFVSLQTLTKCGPQCAPCRRTLSHCRLRPDVVRTCAPHQRTLSCCRLWPNVVQTCAPQQRTLFCYGVWPHMDQKRTHHQKRPVPNKRFLIINQCRTETAIYEYVAIWSIHWKVSVPTSLNKKWQILYPSCDKWQWCRSHTTITNTALYLRRDESILIELTWTSWRFLRAYAGLLVNATMVSLFACQRLKQNGNEGAMPTTTNHSQKAWLYLTTVGSTTTNQILLKLGALQSPTWLATPIVL